MRPEADGEWADAATTIPGMFYWSPGEAPVAERWEPMDPARSLNRRSPVGVPDFADRDDIAAAVEEFQRSGFHGPLNYYRAMRPYFEEASAFAGKTVDQPAFFAFGQEDAMVRMRGIKEAELRGMVTDLRGFLPLEEVGHWPQLEATGPVNEALVGFLEELA